MQYIYLKRKTVHLEHNGFLSILQNKTKMQMRSSRGSLISISLLSITYPLKTNEYTSIIKVVYEKHCINCIYIYFIKVKKKKQIVLFPHSCILCLCPLLSIFKPGCRNCIALKINSLANSCIICNDFFLYQKNTYFTPRHLLVGDK